MPTVRNILLRLYGRTQSLDTVTRWGSTYDMVERLLSFKDYCEQVAAAGTIELALSKTEWDEVKKIKDVLETLKNTTLILQAAAITPGLFMKEWVKLETSLEESEGQIALGILSSMKKRKEKLFENTHFLAGVYVDPRYRILLNSRKKLKAREGLTDISCRLEQNIFDLTEEPLIQLSSQNINTHMNSSEDNDFERELDRLEERQRVPAICNLKNKKVFLEIEQQTQEDCNVIESVGRLRVKSVFEAFGIYPEWIRAACRVASSIPTTQASVERLFSVLKLVLSEQWQRMKDDFFICNFIQKNQRRR